MPSFDWDALAARCQKPDAHRIGNLYARRIVRPLALRITRVVLPWGVSAHGVTLAAWLVGLAAVGALAVGDVAGWLVAAGLLHLSYLLDHVDGQIARGTNTATLDGVELDYRMHHTLTLLVPTAAGYGLARLVEHDGWLLLGAMWALGCFLLGSEYDVRAKALFQRLKRVQGELRVIGGGGGRPAPAVLPRPTVAQVAAWTVRKLLEWHVTIQLVTLVALTGLMRGDVALPAQCVVGLLGPMALIVASTRLVRQLRRAAAEREFAAWFEPPVEQTLVLREGWWIVEPIEAVHGPASIAAQADDHPPTPPAARSS